MTKAKARTKNKETGVVEVNAANLIKRHAGVLGLCAIVDSCPYDVPAYLPDTLTFLCRFVNDPVPIQVRINYTFSCCRK